MSLCYGIICLIIISDCFHLLMNGNKKDQIETFVSFTETSEKIAEQYLSRCKWNMNEAMDLFYEEGSPMPEPEKNLVLPEVDSFFEQHATKVGQIRVLEEDAIEKIFSQILKIDLDDVVIGHLMTNVMQMEKAGILNRQQLYNLFKSTKSSTFKQVSGKINNLRKQLQDQGLYRKMYMQLFNLYTLSKTPNMEYQNAVLIWQIYLKGKMPYFDVFAKYLNDPAKKPAKVYKDLWDMVYEFTTTVKNPVQCSETDGWPIFLDDFVAYFKESNK